jgi:ABC-2 type transport system ATP-binding protein
MPPTGILEIAGLTRRYGKKSALDDVTFSVREGDIFGLLGPNGAGKTTLVRIVLGLIRPTAGSVRIFGAPLPGGALAGRRRIGAMVEIPRFYPWLTGRGNLRTLGLLAGTEAPEGIDRALAEVGLMEVADEPVKGWSQGMRQRLGIAQALLGKPDLVVLDEPTNGLDPHGVREVLALILKINRERKTTFLILSHQLDELQTVADRVAILRHGRLLTTGALDDLLGGPATHHLLLVDDPAKAKEILPGAIEEGERGHLKVAATPDEIPDLLSRLVSSGVRVAEATPVRRSLADWFIDVTRREEDDLGR